MATYVVGDIHGCCGTLRALLERLSPKPGDRFIFLGDLIDRGPDSKSVVDTIWQLEAQGVSSVCLRGNHEQLLLNAVQDANQMYLWLNNGGDTTLRSFGATSPLEIAPEYLDFFQAMPLWHEEGDFLCVHGGLRFSTPDPLSDAPALLWLRHWYSDIDYNWLGNRIVLHGHTPVPKSVIEEQHRHLEKNRYLNLDNGCVYALRVEDKAWGSLVALEIPSRTLYMHPFVG